MGKLIKVNFSKNSSLDQSIAQLVRNHTTIQEHSQLHHKTFGELEEMQENLVTEIVNNAPMSEFLVLAEAKGVEDFANKSLELSSDLQTSTLAFDLQEVIKAKDEKELFFTSKEEIIL